ncbi:S9 family peptidase [Phyllobacterium phragmitis]|uniref:S9 family peptidase n=1 Tax=Phyllobacterium phragmitis TaxID=2670329 RepID=A0A2S9IZ20_9HYPH|nr:S9 family peptidase [Phyllobacterium phragmitis]PRD45781.1 S9 family peptidase [Phyllobacterium phragmitis]
MTKSSVFPDLPYPVAAKKPDTDTRHGITRTDNYAWLRAPNWQEVFKDPSVLDPDIRKHLEAENAYQAALMEDTKALQETLFAEMKGRIKEDESSVPYKDGPYAYGTSFKTGGEQPRFFRTPRDGGTETMLLDGDLEAQGKAYFRLSSTDHSPDHKRLVWGFDDKGSEFYSLGVRDLDTLADLDDSIVDTNGGGVWDAASEGFFYTRLDENHRPSKLYYHRIGTTQKDDRLIHEEEDPGFFMNVSGSSLDDFVFIAIGDHETSEEWIIPANDPTAEPRLVRKRETGVEYNLSEGGDVFFILTNIDGAKDFKIMSAPVNAPERENWTEVVPEKPGTIILGHTAYRDFLVWIERSQGLPRIIVRNRKTGEEHAIAFDEEAYSLGLQGSAEYDTEIIRFSYSSMTTPTQEFDYNMRTRERTLLKTQDVPSGHNPEDYVTRRLLATAGDGELVPVSILYARDTPLDGSAPCLLYGYGSYGMTIPASFNISCLSLVDRGFIYAIAHIRGGKDKGFAWYENGKRDKKINTFTDFIAAAEHLVAEKFTSHDRIIAHGGSAGGMLMGAIANLAPKAFGGIIAEVPFVDVLNTILDESLPLTPVEWPEWGNPVTSEADYRTIASYCPYSNVSAQAYPPILAETGLSDPRVTYWEPAKWVAKLRELKTDKNPVIFRINMDAGHAGASGRFSRLEEVAYNYAFALKVTGKVTEKTAT